MNNHIFRSYVDNITQQYGITEKQMFSDGKSQKEVEPRHLFFYLCSLKEISIVNIQTFLREQGYSYHHVTIRKGMDKINKRVEEHPEYDVLVSKMQKISAKALRNNV